MEVEVEFPFPKLSFTGKMKISQESESESGHFATRYPDERFNLLKDELPLPALVMNEEQIQENARWMQDFARGHGLHLAPHGKTTMCPFLFQQQLKAGAWAISLATASQVSIAYTFRVRRILMVNQLIGRSSMEIISEILQEDPTFEFACLVDSPANVEALGEFFRSRGLALRVLLEYSYKGGRTGIRREEQERQVIKALEKYSDCIHLVGVEFYEAMCETEEQVREFIRHVFKRVGNLENSGIFREQTIIVSAAGSAWMDVVAEEFSTEIKEFKSNGIKIKGVLRPGSYLTHEVETYKDAKQRMSENPSYPLCTMKPALSIWAFVQSIPEEGLAVVTMGKRNVDATFDCEFPIPRMHYRRKKKGGFYNGRVPGPWKISHVMDQHAFLRMGDNDKGMNGNSNDMEVQVGDIITFETPYPGTTMDKYRNVVVVDKDLNLLQVVKTYFE